MDNENIKKINEIVKFELNKVYEKKNSKYNYPLSERTYDSEEIMEMIRVLLSDKLTMRDKVLEFEREFSKYIGSKYALMVNSGSSANLLAMSALVNFEYNKKLNPGDKIIIPTVCWSTSVWPIIQMNLEPVFVDINIKTLNADIEKIEQLLKADEKIKGIMCVHILGNSTNMKKIMEFKSKYDLVIIEDTCESLGSKYNNKYLGTFGECGTYSFYFSHHITTIEGGMIVTDDESLYNIMKCQRSHGWSRGIKNINNNELDNRFCFINIGYNLRPMEIQGAMGLIQLKKLDQQNNNRVCNFNKLRSKILASKSDKIILFEEEPKCVCAWFAFPILVNSKYDKVEYVNHLENNGIETRPIVTGNFTRQPVFKNLKLNYDPSSFENAELIHTQGLFIGIQCYLLSDDKIDKLVELLVN